MEEGLSMGSPAGGPRTREQREHKARQGLLGAQWVSGYLMGLSLLGRRQHTLHGLRKSSPQTGQYCPGWVAGPCH